MQTHQFVITEVGGARRYANVLVRWCELSPRKVRRLGRSGYAPRALVVLSLHPLHTSLENFLRRFIKEPAADPLNARSLVRRLTLPPLAPLPSPASATPDGLAVQIAVAGRVNQPLAQYPRFVSLPVADGSLSVLALCPALPAWVCPW